jgi:regulator of protease activity HflC (stomatin/prohibitin superfamily)
MIKKIGLTGLIVLIVGSSVLFFSSAFTVHQTQQALILRFGEAIRIVTEPGLNFKLPIADDAVYIDKRILDLDSESQEVIASDQKKTSCGCIFQISHNRCIKILPISSNISKSKCKIITNLKLSS